MSQSSVHLSDEELWDAIDNPTAIHPHLKSCLACQTMLAEMKSLDEELRNTPLREPSHEFTSAIIELWNPPLFGFKWFVVLVVVAITIILGLSFYISLSIPVSIDTTFVSLFSCVLVICVYQLYYYRKQDRNLTLVDRS